MNTVKRTWMFSIVCVSLMGMAAWADNWPTWRGPSHNGISAEKNIPVEWSETNNVVWKLPLPGDSGSTPIVWGDKIFLTSPKGNNVVLFCIDGKIIWDRPIGTTKHMSTKQGEPDESASSPQHRRQACLRHGQLGRPVVF